MSNKDYIPLISILTPSWDRAEFLPKLVESLSNQTFRQFEWVIGNDGSIDKTHELLLSKFNKLDFQITYINSSLRIGKAKMDNLLIDNAKADYLLWCDADDFFEPEALKNLYNASKQIPCNERNNYIGVLGQNIDTNGVSQTFNQNNIPANERHFVWEELSKYIIGDGTILILKEHFKQKRFLEEDFLVQESSVLREIFKNKKFYFISDVIKIMDRTAENSISFGNKLRYCRGSAIAISVSINEQFFKELSVRNKIKTIVHYWRYSIHGDFSYYEAKKLWPVSNTNFLVSIFYPLSIVICIRDKFLNKVEKTHIEFFNNIKKTEIQINRF